MKLAWSLVRRLAKKLNELLELVIEKPELNTKKELLKFLWKEK